MMNTQFRPGPESARAFRDALGCFGTGVTIITCLDEHGPLGMTANSFAAVSLDPPLVLWSPAKSSARYGSFVQARDFAIHVLHDGQQGLAASIARDGRSLPDLPLHNGAPDLSDYLVRFSCRQFATHDAGDHTVIIGEVTEVIHGQGTPLLFTQGHYGRFTTGH